MGKPHLFSALDGSPSDGPQFSEPTGVGWAGRPPSGIRGTLPEVRTSAVLRATSWLVPALAIVLHSPARATMPPIAGPVVPEIADAFSRGLLAVPEHPTGLTTSAAREDWLIPIVRIEFTDSSIVHTKAELEQRL